jgi:hypothetical protein
MNSNARWTCAILVFVSTMLMSVVDGLSEPCNTRNFDPNTIDFRKANYPEQTKCPFWTTSGDIFCGTQQGEVAAEAPKWAKGCTAPVEGNVNNDCRVIQDNCQQKCFCTWDPALGCRPGMQMVPPSWYTADRAASANCNPGG